LEKLNNEELHRLYSSPSIIRMMTSRRIRWAGNVAYRILVGKPKIRNHWKDQDVGGWTELKFILEK
jgi:hypothetical protein